MSTQQPPQQTPSDARREWLYVVVGMGTLAAVLALILAVFALADGGSSAGSAPARKADNPPTATPAGAPALADAKGVAFEPYHWVDPTLPAVPAGDVKRFTVDVRQHVTQVDAALTPTEAWSYEVNGTSFPGAAVSPPIVVREGDKVSIDFVNGSTKAMKVTMPHSIDFHSAEVAPNKNYIDVAPAKHLTINFVAKHPGVFMYHCATQPVLMHTSAGMMGMMVVKPRDLPPADRELWMSQEEYYLGSPGAPADMQKMLDERPDVIAFNGYANQYKKQPIPVKAHEHIRMYVLDLGPSKWSAFHVIGTVFDRTTIEGTSGHDAQTVNLAPSQGGWVDFSLDEEGNYPFVTHAFGDMAKGAAGILHTSGAPLPKVPAASVPVQHDASSDGHVTVTMGEMWIKADLTTTPPGKIEFHVSNTGATMHAFAIVKAPAKVSGGSVDESTFLARTPDLAAGQSAKALHVRLEPGSYELICYVPGHYMAGQHMPFTVSG